MGALSFHIVSRSNDDLIISPSELLETFLFGIPLKAKDGHYLSTEPVRMFIKAATKEVEKFLNIKLIRQIISEQKDFNINEFRDWSYVRTTYMVVKPHTMKGFINDTQQITYPPEWLSAR